MKIKEIVLGIIAFAIFPSCNNEDNPVFPEKPTYEVITGFAKGADVSWITEMEKAGKQFYNADGKETECIELMRELGMNAIRLRVWVDPADGWCNADDLLIKAWRAHNLGMRLMIDFHYSDVWADPGAQEIPEAWQGMTLEEMTKAVADHTTEVLTRLKANNLDVEWIQIGNETGNGMLWEMGQADISMDHYAALNNAGYDAAKSVYPDAKMIVHLHAGDNNNLYRWLFDGLKSAGGKWDVIGMSLYPEVETWQEMNNSCLANMQDMITRYNCEVMLCEVGMPWDEAEAGKLFLADLFNKAKGIADNKCLGIFYWEPQAYGGWKEYQLGAFDESGKPTIALDAFLD